MRGECNDNVKSYRIFKMQYGPLKYYITDFVLYTKEKFIGRRYKI